MTAASNNANDAPESTIAYDGCSFIVKSRILQDDINFLQLEEEESLSGSLRECTVFLLPLQLPNEGVKMYRLRELLTDEAHCVDMKSERRIWRLLVDASTVLTKLVQLGFTISAAAISTKDNVHTWTVVGTDDNTCALEASKNCKNFTGNNQLSRDDGPVRQLFIYQRPRLPCPPAANNVLRFKSTNGKISSNGDVREGAKTNAKNQSLTTLTLRNSPLPIAPKPVLRSCLKRPAQTTKMNRNETTARRDDSSSDADDTNDVDYNVGDENSINDEIDAEENTLRGSKNVLPGSKNESKFAKRKRAKHSTQSDADSDTEEIPQDLSHATDIPRNGEATSPEPPAAVLLDRRLSSRQRRVAFNVDAEVSRLCSASPQLPATRNKHSATAPSELSAADAVQPTKHDDTIAKKSTKLKQPKTFENNWGKAKKVSSDEEEDLWSIPSRGDSPQPVSKEPLVEITEPNYIKYKNDRIILGAPPFERNIDFNQFTDVKEEYIYQSRCVSRLRVYLRKILLLAVPPNEAVSHEAPAIAPAASADGSASEYELVPDAFKIALQNLLYEGWRDAIETHGGTAAKAQIQATPPTVRTVRRQIQEYFIWTRKYVKNEGKRHEGKRLSNVVTVARRTVRDRKQREQRRLIAKTLSASGSKEVPVKRVAASKKAKNVCIDDESEDEATSSSSSSSDSD